MTPKSLRQIHVKELGFWDCFNGGFALWRLNFNTIVLTFASVSIPSTLLNHVIGIFISGFSSVLLQTFISTIANTFTILASAKIIESFLLKKPLSYSEALIFASQKFVPGFVVGMLFIVGSLLSTILLIIPGILFVICFWFAVPSVILRNTRGFEAFHYSYRLAKNQLYPIFIKFLGVSAVILVIALINLALLVLQKTFPSLLSGILSQVLFSFPILIMLLVSLNLDYLQNGFPGEMDVVNEISEAHMLSLKPGDLSANSLQVIEERAKLQQKERQEKEKSSSFLNSRFFREISKRFLQNNISRKLAEWQKILAENPNDVRIQQKIAEIDYKLGRTDEATRTFLQIAQHFEKENFLLKAIKAYKNILLIKPDLIEINLRLAQLYKKMNMPLEASNQYRIVISTFAMAGNREKVLELAQELVKVDPSQENRTKLAEIYQMNGMKEESLKQYEDLAKQYRLEKKYDKLLNVYEIILPHRPQNTAVIKDICILHLRNQNPHRCLQIIDQYRLSQDQVFIPLIEKATLMVDVLKRQKAG